MRDDYPNLLGVAEIAERLGVKRQRVSMWDARRLTSGFPAPVMVRASGPFYDFDAVHEWFVAKYPEEVKTS